MAIQPRTPGVYIEEIRKFPPSVAGVETAIPAFIGYTEKAEKNGENLHLKPTKIRSLVEYVQFFDLTEEERKEAGRGREANIEVALEGTTSNFTIRPSLNRPSGESVYMLYYAMQHYFANGGGPCYIISVGKASSGTGDAVDYDGFSSGLNALKMEDEPTIIVAPEAVLNLVDSQYGTLIADTLGQCSDLQDRVAVFDVKTTFPEEGNPTEDDALTFRNNVPVELELKKYGAAYYPYLKTTLNYEYLESDVLIVDNRVVDATGDTVVASGTALADVEDGLKNRIRSELTNNFFVDLPPGAAIAGIYARVDDARGVWKAPANVSVNAVIRPLIKIDNPLQDGLNVDSTAGKSINAIRAFTGKGILVWGARTLAGNDNEWRYVNVRRFFNFAEESIKKASEQFVFEPNDANTWAQVKAMIENFLILQWRAGALAGAKPNDAFFVKVGLGETMTALDILEGRMNVEIGMAVVRPAEFIILKFSHKMQVS